MKIVINVCYGGFGISDKAYEKLIEWGVPVQKYSRADRDESTGLYPENPANEGEVIFDKELTEPGECQFNDIYHEYKGRVRESRYWDTWLRSFRTHPLLIRVVEELGSEANGPFADLKIVEVPDDVHWDIEEYDGIERVAEQHRTWA